jgi:hypothetical protein
MVSVEEETTSCSKKKNEENEYTPDWTTKKKCLDPHVDSGV